MTVGQIETSVDVVGQSELGANFLEEPAAEAAAEDLVHDCNGGHIGIMAVDAEAKDLHIGLIHIFLVDEVETRLGSWEFIVARRLGGDRRKGLEDRAQSGFHGNRIEVALQCRRSAFP